MRDLGGHTLRHTAVHIVSANRDVETWDKELFFLLADQKNKEILRRLVHKNSLEMTDFNDKLGSFVRTAKENRNRTYFIVIRCPDRVPYTLVMQILSTLSQADNVEYGCLGGDLQELLDSKVTTGTFEGKTVLKLDF